MNTKYQLKLNTRVYRAPTDALSNWSYRERKPELLNELTLQAMTGEMLDVGYRYEIHRLQYRQWVEDRIISRPRHTDPAESGTNITAPPYHPGSEVTSTEIEAALSLLRSQGWKCSPPQDGEEGHISPKGNQEQEETSTKPANTQREQTPQEPMEPVITTTEQTHDDPRTPTDLVNTQTGQVHNSPQTSTRTGDTPTGNHRNDEQTEKQTETGNREPTDDVTDTLPDTSTIRISNKAAQQFKKYKQSTNVFYMISKDVTATEPKTKSHTLAAWACPCAHASGFGAGFTAYMPGTVSTCFACETSRKSKKGKDTGVNMDFALPDSIRILQLAERYYVDRNGVVRVSAEHATTSSGRLTHNVPVRTGIETIPEQQFFGHPFRPVHTEEVNHHTGEIPQDQDPESQTDNHDMTSQDQATKSQTGPRMNGETLDSYSRDFQGKWNPINGYTNPWKTPKGATQQLKTLRAARDTTVKPMEPIYLQTEHLLTYPKHGLPLEEPRSAKRPRLDETEQNKNVNGPQPDPQPEKFHYDRNSRDCRHHMEALERTEDPKEMMVTRTNALKLENHWPDNIKYFRTTTLDLIAERLTLTELALEPEEMNEYEHTVETVKLSINFTERQLLKALMKKHKLEVGQAMFDMTTKDRAR
ncbi:hypothetical protein K504DRAFT_456134 [Pleomassaria siparia CBS 279.74]|uniref:Uncharacterized protein n=1 Tax=Pleomassaria siparia CBS 279.74 TaxID=1314801 RepID=A0A6G1K5J6_9PLEO|nr:hypothetical protein K504DRAFT_456134 [Pleomassaria siparia CBS 279.74]